MAFGSVCQPSEGFQAGLGTTPCATMWRIVLVGRSLDRMASWCQGPRCVGSVAVMGPERIDGGQRRGAQSRSRGGSGSTVPDNESMRISHEDIYQALYVQGRGALRRELVACLRTGRALRVPRARTRQRGNKFVSPEIMITQSPAEADDRAVPGHWEGDLTPGTPQLRDRNPCGTHHPVHDAGTPSTHARPRRRATSQKRARPHRPRRPSRPRRYSVVDHGAPQTARPFLDLGPGRRNGPKRPAPPSTSATPKVPGNVEPTRTPTASSASTSPKAPTSTDTYPPT